MSIERSCWRNKEQLLWGGYPGNYKLSTDQLVKRKEIPKAKASLPEAGLLLPALFILVDQAEEHEQLV
jgi:hypothetical protein